jgi:hypothetical protein
MDEKGFMLGVTTKRKESLLGANMSKEDISSTFRMEIMNGLQQLAVFIQIEQLYRLL